MGKSRTHDQLRRILLRQAKTKATNTHGRYGQEKVGGHKPRPISLPRLKCLEDGADDDGPKGQAKEDATR